MGSGSAWLSWEWIWLFWEWILAVLGEDLAGLGVDLPGCLRVDLAVLGVDLPVSGNVAVWEWYFAANFGGEFRFGGEFGSCGSKSSYPAVNSGAVAVNLVVLGVDLVSEGWVWWIVYKTRVTGKRPMYRGHLPVSPCPVQ